MNILTIAIQKNDQVVSASYELIEAAKQLSGNIVTVVLGNSISQAAAELASRGGGKVLSYSDERLRFFNDEIYTNIIGSIIEKHEISLVLAPAGFYGKALMSRLAAKNGGKMVSEVSSISADGENIVVSRFHYGGSVVSDITANGEGTFFVTMRQKIYPESNEGQGEVITETADESLFASRTEVKEMKTESAGSVNLTEADIIVSAGRGMKGPEHLHIVRELAESLNAAFGASRAVVDAGWVSYSHQVGQTGKTVNPKLYIACAISGAIQHLVGMRTAKTIVAVNKDKDAPIFNVANYGIVGDAFEIVPALTAKFKKELQD